PLDTATTSQSRIPRPQYDTQDKIFSRAWRIVSEAIDSKGIDQRAFPGGSVAVTHCGNLLALKGIGRFSYDANSSEVKPDTIFDLASLTKVVATTTMAMILYERGLLDLEAPVLGILPELCGRGDRVEDPRRR